MIDVHRNAASTNTAVTLQARAPEVVALHPRVLLIVVAVHHHG
jgi:hypothetical protein